MAIESESGARKDKQWPEILERLKNAPKRKWSLAFIGDLTFLICKISPSFSCALFSLSSDEKIIVSLIHDGDGKEFLRKEINKSGTNEFAKIFFEIRDTVLKAFPKDQENLLSIFEKEFKTP